MFKSPQQTSQTARNIPKNLPAPVGGLDAYSSLMNMQPNSAVMLNNWVPYPDRLQMRDGYAVHMTAFANVPYRLWVYANGAGVETLWATTDAGVYAATTAGTAGSAAIALTSGKTASATLATGANTYLVLVNGTDTLKLYDGTTWSSVSTMNAGAYSTVSLKCVEVYRQRLFFSEKNSLILRYLAINTFPATGNTITSYDLGALFRRGGKIVSIATWTLDGGTGPEDQLAIITSKGEVGVFSGSDPSSASSWALRGIYYIGKPLGENCLFKSGGDLLAICENGLYPLSNAVQSAAIERTNPITAKVRALFNAAARDFSGEEGWQIISQPNIPLIIVNIPSIPVRQQLIMHQQTGAWATFSGWNAYAFARLGATLYFSTSTGIMKVTGVNDAGGNITATMLQAFSRFGYPRAKQIIEIKPYFLTAGNFSYNLGVASDFGVVQDASMNVRSDLGSLPLWGTALWGSAVWAADSVNVQDWQGVADGFSIHKAIYCQVTSLSDSIRYYGSDILYLPGGSF